MTRETSHTATRAGPVLAACAFFFALVAAARLFYVEAYALPIPFWDQWDSEGDLLLRPWMEGTLPLSRLWETHNEHRIMMSRLITLGLFEITGVWDNMFSARLNTVIVALCGAGLLWLPMRRGELHGARWVVVPVLLAGLVLPFGWENFLVGFQSQFYVLVLFNLASLALASHLPDDGRAQAAMLLIAVACCLTMASGILTPVATAGVLLCHAWCIRRLPTRRAFVVVVLIAIALIGYGTTPKLEYHAGLRAAGVREWLDAFNHMLAWPVPRAHWPAFLLWAPGTIGVLWTLHRRNAGKIDLLMAGLVAWSVMQAAAAAYSRGHGMIYPSSRYLDLLVPGLVANAWFAARLLEHARGVRLATIGAAAIAAAFCLTFAYGHVVRFKGDWAAMNERRALSVHQTRNVIRYVETGDLSALDKPHLHIPYPDRVRLKSLLNDPHLRGALLRGDALTDPSTGRRAIPKPPANTPPSG